VSSIPYGKLPTEQNNAASRRISEISVRKALELINREDQRIAPAVRKQTATMEKAVKLIVASLKKDGRLFLLGAGTSGRLGVLEAAECPPTFNTPSSLVQAFMAGGNDSVFRSKEGAEDRGEDAQRLVSNNVRRGDAVIGIAASGVTAFVGEGLKTARKRGAKTILVTCYPGVSRSVADAVIAVSTGPEVIAGSTRLKAATATKMVLNSLTVVSMVQLGKVYKNWMVDLQPRSKKLRARATRLVGLLGGVPEPTAIALLAAAGGNAKTAILMAKKKISYADAVKKLEKVGGYLHKALA
jgi:N-acetylmuramic acid 6-phosphate etherase